MTQEEKQKILDMMPGCIDRFVENGRTVYGFDLDTEGGPVNVIMTGPFFSNLVQKIANAIRDNRLEELRKIIDF